MVGLAHQLGELALELVRGNEPESPPANGRGSRPAERSTSAFGYRVCRACRFPCSAVGPVASIPWLGYLHIRGFPFASRGIVRPAYAQSVDSCPGWDGRRDRRDDYRDRLAGHDHQRLELDWADSERVHGLSAVGKLQHALHQLRLRHRWLDRRFDRRRCDRGCQPPARTSSSARPVAAAVTRSKPRARPARSARISTTSRPTTPRRAGCRCPTSFMSRSSIPTSTSPRATTPVSCRPTSARRSRRPTSTIWSRSSRENQTS